ncbi:MAG: hypothetical protein V3575_06290 [Candidatus Absconditabacteria bacterium]
MIKALKSLFFTHWVRIVSMGIVFSIVVLIITLIEQIILNIDKQISKETRPLVGADVTIESSTNFDNTTYNNISKIVEDNGGKAIPLTEFYTTIEGVTEPKLVQVKAIEQGYPYYGELTFVSLDNQTQGNSKTTFLSGSVRIDSQTYELIGKQNTIKVGTLQLPIAGIITEQASLGFNFLDQGRTIFLPYNLISKTNLTDFGSRVDYKILIKTDNDEQAIQIKETIQREYNQLYQVRLAKDRIEQLGNITSQLDQYTSIILIITLILSLMIITTATMTMTIRVKNSVAIMRIIGITRLQTIVMISILLGSLFVIGYLIGIGLAYTIFKNIRIFIPLASEFVRYPEQLLIVGVLSIICFFVACRESLRYLSMTHPLSLLRQDGAKPQSGSIISVIITGIGSWLILSILNSNALFSAGIVILLGIILFVGYKLLLWVFRSVHSLLHGIRRTHFSFFDASRQTVIPGNQTGLLVGGLSSALIAFCVITAMSLSFIDRLSISEKDQPNLFIINVRDEDLTKIKEIDTNARLYDTILGRIVNINSISLNNHLEASKRESGEFTREFNMTSQSLENSPIIKGKPLSEGGVSLDEGFAKRLGVQIGDMLELSIQGRSFELQITSLRKSIRSGAEPFFFIQLDSKQFAQAPRSRFWVTRQPPSQLSLFQKSVLENVGRHLSFIDVSAIISLVANISTKVISIIFICMSIIVLLILMASVASNEASALVSQRTYRLYNVIGMTKKQLTNISRFVGIIYIVATGLIVCVLVPLILRFIYSRATILIWSRSILIPFSIGIVTTLSVMVLSYWGFHRIIIQGVGKKIR